MPKQNSIESEELKEFNLKHRITGAAVLLFFGAAFLPWLLGPPSQANKVDPELLVDNAVLNSEPVDEIELLIDDDIEIEETVFVSKITPLDANKPVDDLQTKAEKAASKKSQDTTKKSNDQKQDLQSVEAKAVLDKTNKKVDEKLASEAKIKQQALAKAAQDRRLLETKQKQAETALQEKLLKENITTPSSDVVDIGWIVQVGLFTEKDRAIAFVSELKRKGFSPSSNVVDTNRGKDTGTRVWLGPFARKAGAAKEEKRFKAKIGKDGWIRDYP